MSDTPTPDDQPEALPNTAKGSPFEGLFDDLEDIDGEETIEDIRAERDKLAGDVQTFSRMLNEVQRDNMELVRKNQEAQNALGRAEAKLKEFQNAGIEKFVAELLPVIDTLELGLKAMQKDRGTDTKFDKMAQGVEKTLAQLTTVFNKFGIREINPMGQDFNMREHDVITTRDVEGVDPETVVEVVKKGYKTDTRLIRPASVIVTPS